MDKQKATSDPLGSFVHGNTRSFPNRLSDEKATATHEYLGAISRPPCNLEGTAISSHRKRLMDSTSQGTRL